MSVAELGVPVDRSPVESVVVEDESVVVLDEVVSVDVVVSSVVVSSGLSSPPPDSPPETLPSPESLIDDGQISVDVGRRVSSRAVLRAGRVLTRLSASCEAKHE